MWNITASQSSFEVLKSFTLGNCESSHAPFITPCVASSCHNQSRYSFLSALYSDKVCVVGLAVGCSSGQD
jgi:hypothetical protein